jgi:hypothetical protein
MQFGSVPNGDGTLADMFMCQDIGQHQNTDMDIGFLVIGEETAEGIFGYLANGNKFRLNSLKKAIVFLNTNNKHSVTKTSMNLCREVLKINGN